MMHHEAGQTRRGIHQSPDCFAASVFSQKELRPRYKQSVNALQKIVSQNNLRCQIVLPTVYAVRRLTQGGCRMRESVLFLPHYNRSFSLICRFATSSPAGGRTNRRPTDRRPDGSGRSKARRMASALHPNFELRTTNCELRTTNTLTPPGTGKTSDNPSPVRSRGWGGPAPAGAPRSAAAGHWRPGRRCGASARSARWA